MRRRKFKSRRTYSKKRRAFGGRGKSRRRGGAGRQRIGYRM